MLRLLLWQRIVVWRNELLHQSWRKRITGLLGLLMGGAFIGLVFVTGIGLFDILLRREPALVPGLITGGFTLLSTVALFWGIGSVLTDLYLTSDVELLLAAPVPQGAIFGLKLIVAMWESAVPALIPVTTLLAYGVAAHARLSYYLGVAIVLVLLLAALAAFSMVLVMLLMRVMPPTRAREIYSLAYVIFFAAIWVGWMMLSRRGAHLAQAAAQFGAQFASTGSQLALPPASWAGAMMLAWTRGDWGTVAGNGILVAIASTLVVGLAYWLFDRSFHHDWATMQEVAGRARRARPNGAALHPPLAPGQRLAAWLPWPAHVLAAKDWITLPRDLRQLSRLVMPLVVSLFYVYQFGFATPDLPSVPGAHFWLLLMILPIVPLFSALALGTPSIGKEGGNFELLRVVPLSPSALLWGKVWTAAVPTALIGGLVTAVVAALLHFTSSQTASLLLLACMLSAVMCMIAVALGALTPNFGAADLRRAVGPLASYGTMFGSALVWGVTLATVGVVAVRLPANQPLTLDLARFLADSQAADLLLFSPWPFLAVMVLDGLVVAGLALLWLLATRHVAAWQPAE